VLIVVSHLTASCILLECPHYGEAHLAYHLHSKLSSMLYDYFGTISGVSAFLSAVGLAMSI
jgi:hypothetical protein